METIKCMFPLNINTYMILPTTDSENFKIFVLITGDHSFRGQAPNIYSSIF